MSLTPPTINDQSRLTKMHKSLQSAISIIALVLIPATALAHAYPAHEIPPSGAILHQLPPTLSIKYTETVNGHFSGIIVNGPKGKPVSRGIARLVPGHSKTLAVALRPSDQPGRYTVLWHALASDGHRTAGRYYFQVKP